MPRKNKTSVDDFKTIFDEAAEAVCECVHAAHILLTNGSPDFREAVERHFPEKVKESSYWAAAGGFEGLVRRLQRAETRFPWVRQRIRELYTLPPEPLGNLSGPSFHDMGLRFAERVFNCLQMIAGFPGIWSIPLRGVTDEHLRQRAVEIGKMAESLLPQLWHATPDCDANRLCDAIETEAANAMKAALETAVEKRLKALEERMNHVA